MATDFSSDLFNPAPNSRRAMALCVAMVVAADGRFSDEEQAFVMDEALPQLNRLGDERARLRKLQPQRKMFMPEFRTIYAACLSAIGPSGVPDDQFVSRVLATVTELDTRKVLFKLMLTTAVSDGLDPAREAGILRFCLEEWGLDATEWPQISATIAEPAP